MSTTVTHKPERFDAQTVNQILPNEEVSDMHGDELADLWGYLRSLTEGNPTMMDIHSLSDQELDIFIQLYEVVEKDKLRYEIPDYGRLSPGELGRKVRSRNTNRITPEEPESLKSSTKINLNRISNQEVGPMTPQHSITGSGDSLQIIVEDEDAEFSDTRVYGTNSYDNTYEIKIDDLEIGTDINEPERIERNNGVTTFYF